jgi:hypothetical protein
VHFSTAPIGNRRYAVFMQFTQGFLPPGQARAATIAVWGLGALAMARWADVTTPAGWTLVAVGAILPAVVLLRLWKTPTPSLSESIHKARD